MADEVQISVDTAALEKALQALPEKIAKRVLGNALQAGGDVLLGAAKALAPERTDETTPESTSLPPGILRVDLRTQVQLGKTGGGVKVGPTEIAGRVGRWQNNGWMLTRGKRKVRNIPGKHFMEAAFDESGSSALDAFVSVLTEGIAEATGTVSESAPAEETIEGE